MKSATRLTLIALTLMIVAAGCVSIRRTRHSVPVRGTHFEAMGRSPSSQVSVQDELQAPQAPKIPRIDHVQPDFQQIPRVDEAQSSEARQIPRGDEVEHSGSQINHAVAVQRVIPTSNPLR